MLPGSALILVTRIICSRVALLLRQDDYVGSLVGMAGPWSHWWPSSDLCRGCQMLVGSAGVGCGISLDYTVSHFSYLSCCFLL